MVKKEEGQSNHKLAKSRCYCLSPSLLLGLRKVIVFLMLTFHFSIPTRSVNTEENNGLSMNREEIYLETEKGYFPCVGWSDLTLSVIIMWIGNVVKMLDPNYAEQDSINYFMDGPYSFNVQRFEKDSIEIKFMKHVGETQKEEMPSLNTTFTNYCNALLALAENVISDPSFPEFDKERERTNLKKSVIVMRTWLQSHT